MHPLARRYCISTTGTPKEGRTTTSPPPAGGPDPHQPLDDPAVVAPREHRADDLLEVEPLLEVRLRPALTHGRTRSFEHNPRAGVMLVGAIDRKSVVEGK